MPSQIKPPRPRAPTGHFRPAPRGTVAKALSTLGGLAQVSPESPRPAEMLDSVALHQPAGFNLTVDDEILHDLLASKAYEADQSMADQMHTLRIADAQRYLNSRAIEHNAKAEKNDDRVPRGRVERSDVLASLRRLKMATVTYGAAGGRKFADVSLLEWWSETTEDEDVVRYRLPAPIRELLGTQPRYAYLELAALPTMSSKYSLRLYKRLALEASKRKWVPGEDNTIRLSPTPAELAGWVGFPLDASGGVKAGKLRERVLDHLPKDFADVRAFRIAVAPRKGGGRGAPVEAIDIELTLSPPERRAVRLFFQPSLDPVRVGRKDLEEYMLDSRTVRRANATFGRAMGLIHGSEFSALWQIALEEALSGDPISDGYATRPTRGEQLLAAIASRGADHAAWDFFGQECAEPDIRLIRHEDFSAYLAREKAADEARYERLGDEAPRGTRKRAPAFIADETAAAPVAEPQAVPTDLTLEDCNAVVFPVDPACGSLEVDDVGTFIAKMTWTGNRAVDVILRFGAHGHETWTVGRYPVSEDDIDTVLRRFRTAISDIEEFE
ncbi:hypothetical protein [Aquibium microcysteis]|uniref:hypothetical protein n=1 Tax=Aquibium microcysteis TaxID=675281 RepID=UPI00165CF24A|nr:hypothetical protein [Aquibium microcysteis]